MNKRPEWNGDELRGRLRQYDRAPFLDLLSHWMENAPSAEAIEKLATRSPDKYISAMTQLARIAGFTEKSESTVDINVHISQMSDSQLEDYIRENMKTIDVTPEAPAIEPPGENEIASIAGSAAGPVIPPALPCEAPLRRADEADMCEANGVGTPELLSQTGTQQEHASTEQLVRMIFKRHDEQNSSIERSETK